MESGSGDGPGGRGRPRRLAFAGLGLAALAAASLWPLHPALAQSFQGGPPGAILMMGAALLALGLIFGAWLGRRSAAARGSGALAEPLAALLEEAPIGCYATDAAGHVYYMNATLQRWLGVKPEDLAARHVQLHELCVIPPSGAVPYSVFADPYQKRGEVTLKGAEGRPVVAFLQQTRSARRIGGGPAALGVVHNLTQARALEAAMQRFEQRFQRFFEQAPLGVALVDADGRLEMTNQAFRAMVGDGEAVKNGSLIELIAEADREAVQASLAEALGDGARTERPIDILLAGAGGRSATLYAVRRDVDGDQRPGLILQFIDTTERRKLERQFAQSQKMQAVGQLAGGIAHDFNNLLTAMIGFCDLLLLRHRAGDQSFADIMQIKQNANRAANLVRQLLAFSRQQTLIPRVLDVTDVLAELSHLLRRLIGANIELQMVHGRELHAVKVDHGQLEQVIINLAVNARDAMPEGGKLTIRTNNVSNPGQTVRGGEVMPPGDYVRIEVADSGTGIAPNVIEHIFEPFFSTKEVGAGTGLGLATVYGIVKQTGGFIFVESRMGEGAVFSIYLPRHAAVAAEPAQRKTGEGPAADLTGMGTVLLVEDEDAVRLFGARALRNKGYNVFEARSGEAALEILKAGKQAIDLLITDVVMPRMDGPALIREVRQLRPELKVIFISGYAEEDFRKRLDENMEMHFLAKPFSLAQLAEKVKEVLHQRAA
ncbi:MAG: response regulator [Hyphomicrobium sp.]|uniref:hybrid sensor histidine kinase/response regulator n=1 Tax=Hyphomicrobium sp. TaxID=82 RepID=UPI003D11AFBA